MAYRQAVLILAVLVTISQFVRIFIVATEIRPVQKEYKEVEPSTLMFCIVSILLGISSLFLEGLLAYSVKKNNLHGIQPYFLCTLFIFLISLLGAILTFSIYIINPIDHNSKVPKRIEEKFKKDKANAFQNYINTSGILESTNSPELLLQDDIKFDLDISNTSSLTIQIIQFNGTIRDIKLNSSSRSFLLPENNQITEKWNAIKVVDNENDSSNQANNINNSTLRTGRKISIAEHKHTHQHNDKKHKPMQLLKYYQVRPVLTLSYLIDLVRCLPQLYFVNRFVKTEKLHTHLVSHPSLSALYVRHV